MSPDARNLNPSQQRALQSATTQRLTLVQGPPGTGKTATATTIIAHWVRSRTFNGAVLCCSDSNIAVDNLLEGLVKKGIRAVRLGRPESTRPDLLRHSIDEMLSIQLGPNPDPQSKHLAKNRIISNAEVICATCIGAGSAVLSGKSGKGQNGKKGFAGVLIDEAAQATELACVVPLMLGCQQLVLVGDHHQLPPTVISEQAEAEGLTLSLFERLVKAGVEPCLLDTQYRMHPAISQFPSDCFYGGNIADGITARDRPDPKGVDWPRPGFPVMFIPSHGQERSDGTSKTNSAEVEIVADVVSRLLAGGLKMSDIGIVTGYGSQVRLIRSRLGHDRREVECQSVDGFQGREKAAIIFSAVRSNHGGNVGFLADWCRTNVAVTRAKNGLIVIGNEATLRSDKRSWEPFINWAYAQGVVVGAVRKGEYDKDMQTRTRALATGRKDYLEKAKAAQRSRAGVAPVHLGSASSSRDDPYAPRDTASSMKPSSYTRTAAVVPRSADTRPPASAAASASARDTIKSAYATVGDPKTNTPMMRKDEILQVVQRLDTGWIDIITENGTRGYVWKDWVAEHTSGSAGAASTVSAPSKRGRWDDSRVNRSPSPSNPAKKLR